MRNWKKLTEMAIFLMLLTALLLPATIEVRKVSAQEILTPREETYVIVTNIDLKVFDNWNPFVPGAVQWNSYFYRLLCEPMYTIDVYTKKIVWWRMVGYNYSNDYKDLTIKLREGVHWSDGAPFTAEDVKFNVLLSINYSVGRFGTWAPYLVSIDTPDDYTVVFHFNESMPRAHLKFRWGDHVEFVPKHIWEGKDPLAFKWENPVMTGPYKILKTFPELGQIYYIRDDNWWGKDVFGLPGPKYVLVKSRQPTDVVLAQLIAGEIDYGHTLLSNYPALKAAMQMSPYIKLITYRESITNGYMINSGKYPLSLSEFRRAIAYAIDYDKLASLLPSTDKGQKAKTPYWYPTEWPGLEKYYWEDLYEKYRIDYNIAEAKRILDGLNFKDRDGDGIRETPNGTKLEFVAIAPTGVAEFEYMLPILQECLQQIGIKVDTKLYDWGLMTSKLKIGDYDFCASWMGISLDGDPFSVLYDFHSKFFTPVGNETGNHYRQLRYKNPEELDPILEQLMRVSPDSPEAEPLYKKAIEIILRDLPLIGCTISEVNHGVSTRYWVGFPTDWMPIGPHHEHRQIFLHLRPRTAVEYVGVWFTGEVATFTGVDGKSYGPFTSGQYERIPKEDAERLINEGLASYTVPTSPEISQLVQTVSQVNEAVSSLNENVASLTGSISSLSTLIYALIGLQIIAIIIAIYAAAKK